MTIKQTKAVSTIPEIAEAENALADMAKQQAPMVQRRSQHRDRIELAIKELESERFELQSRRDLVRRQAEAVEQGLAMHLDDIEATIRLYEAGIQGDAPE